MFLLPLLVLQVSTRLNLDLAKPGVAVSPSLYGLMTEEINHSYDGGLYAELVRNRAFQDAARMPVDWSAVDGGTIELDRAEHPSPARPVSLRVRGGAANAGFWGYPMRPRTHYSLTLVAKADAPGPIEATLESSDGSRVFAKAEVDGVGPAWRRLTARLATGAGIQPTADARLVLRTGASRTVWLGFVSLFPPTYHHRLNGNRVDLMNLLVAMRPRFLRFPGGNYLEGGTIAERFPWAHTLGPIEDRPGHQCPWGYRSTDGMGLLEFLEWCEDMHAKPLLAVYAGYSLGGQVVKAGPGLEPFVHEALDEIEYATGGPETTWGARRIRDGHPGPFDLAAVEVGNEDGFDRSGSYPGRFAQFEAAIKAKYPHLAVISTTGGQDWLGQRFPMTHAKPDLVDEHYYASTWDMMAMADKYDAYDRKGPKVFVGEWASQDVPAPWADAAHKGPTPNMKCAVADAAFMTGLERNSDVVAMACYAPLLVNVNPGARQWAVNLIGYDALTSFGSPSYYAQKMFSESVGDQTVPFSLEGVPEQHQNGKTLPGIFASVTRDTRHHQLFVKLVNALQAEQAVEFRINGAVPDAVGSQITLTSDPSAMNDIANPKRVAPATSRLDGVGPVFRDTLAPNSVTVLRLAIR